MFSPNVHFYMTRPVKMKNINDQLIAKRHSSFVKQNITLKKYKPGFVSKYQQPKYQLNIYFM